MNTNTEHTILVSASDIIWLDIYKKSAIFLEPHRGGLTGKESSQPYSVVVKSSAVSDEIKEGVYVGKNDRIAIRSAYKPKIIVDDNGVEVISKRLDRAMVENVRPCTALVGFDLEINIKRSVIAPNSKWPEGNVFLNVASIRPIIKTEK